MEYRNDIVDTIIPPKTHVALGTDYLPTLSDLGFMTSEEVGEIDKDLDRFTTPTLLKKLPYDLQDHSVLWHKINNHRWGKHPRKNVPS